VKFTFEDISGTVPIYQSSSAIHQLTSLKTNTRTSSEDEHHAGIRVWSYTLTLTLPFTVSLDSTGFLALDIVKH